MDSSIGRVSIPVRLRIDMLAPTESESTVDALADPRLPANRQGFDDLP